MCLILRTTQLSLNQSTGNISGSTANHTLSTPELASHSHPGGGSGSSPAPVGVPTGFRASGVGNTGSAGGGGGHSHNMSANFTGDSTSVLQPYLTVVYIIKTQEIYGNKRNMDSSNG